MMPPNWKNLLFDAGRLVRDAFSNRPADRCLTAAELKVAASSDAVRARFRQLGVVLPELRVLLRRSDAEVLAFEVPSTAAIARWHELRAITDRTGFYPLVFRDPYGGDQRERAEELAASPVAVTLQAAATMDATRWFEGRRREARALATRESEDVVSWPSAPAVDAIPVDDIEPLFTVPFDLASGKPTRGVFLLLLPTTDGCEFAAYLEWGGWNACPEPTAHVAVLRHWQRTYGAEPVAVTHDYLELLLPKALGSWRSARIAAEEQSLYCDEVATEEDWQQTLIRDVARSRLWAFWWD